MVSAFQQLKTSCFRCLPRWYRHIQGLHGWLELLLGEQMRWHSVPMQARRWRFVLHLETLYVALLNLSVLASPNHDDVQASTPIQTSRQQYSTGRRLSSFKKSAETCEQIHTKSMEHIRIGYEMMDVEGVDPKVVHHIQHNILARAISYWSRALKVHRVTAPLRAERQGKDCEKYGLGFQSWVLAAEKGFTCTEASPPRCGDGVRIPAKYLKETRVCSRKCPRILETLMHLLGKAEGVCDECTTLPGGPGASGYDFVAFVTIKNSSFCGPMTQAHASTCVKDQCDRPIFGWINFCPTMVSLDPKDSARQVSTAMHELAHALAFTSHLYGYYRNADGTPKMPRDPNDPSQLRDSVQWSCSGTSWTWNDPTGNRRWVDPSVAGIVMKFNERGLDSCPCPVGLSQMYPGCILPLAPAFREPKCIFKVTMPKVREKAREYFGCDWLQGAELENQPTSSCVIVGSHWEERIFMGELMTSGQFGDYIFLSEITLALFEDSGWYRPDYSMADPLTKGVHWGYQLGCNFAVEKCVSDGKTEFPRFWCDKPQGMKCSLSRKQQVMCTMVQSPVVIKPAFQFFNDGLIGDTAEADYCPYFHTPIGNHICTDPNSATFPISNANFMREVFGEDSRCLDSTLHGEILLDGLAYPASPELFTESRPGCFKIACGAGRASYDVMVSDLHGSVEKLGTCTRGGQALTQPLLAGQVTCAPPEELCAEGLGTPRHVQQFGEAAAPLQLDEEAGPVLAETIGGPSRWPLYAVVVSGVAGGILLFARQLRHVSQPDKPTPAFMNSDEGTAEHLMQ